MKKILIYLFFIFFASVYLTCTGFGNKLASSENGFDRIGLIFSILIAGIITIMSIVRLSRNTSENWDVLWKEGKLNVSRLTYLKSLFFLLMTSLALMVFYEITEHSTLKSIILKLLGFNIPFSFLLSLPIPSVLSKIKVEQMNEQIQKARKKQ